MKNRKTVGIVGGTLLAGFLFLVLLWLPNVAGAVTPESTGNGLSWESSVSINANPIFQEDDPAIPPSDQACRLCHQDSTREVEFPSGETLPVMIDVDALDKSAHGAHPGPALSCTDCHSPADYQFPHEPVAEEDLRTFNVAQAESCERCHQQPHLNGHPGPETENPVVCTDCHGSHDVETVEEIRTGAIADRCVDCHTDSGVGIIDPHILTDIVRKGLFADRVDSDYCLSCHSQEGLTLVFASGDELSLTIDEDALHNSVHGADNSWQALDCVDCHDRYTFPHKPVEAASLREYNLERYTFCAKCHEGHYELTLDSVHGDALVAGNHEAAVCTDCHGAHDTPTPGKPRERISQTCRQCHSTIYDTYAGSIHGEALLLDSNPDVPVCIDCHGVHNIDDPTTAMARNRSPELCAQCHADDELMTRYGISTNVFDSYVADFHGETVALFEHEDPSLPSDKAVCFDCHGVHNIRPVDDPENGIKANLLIACRQCHPDATENFPDAWTSHYEPSLEHNPLVYLVDSFYKVVIPVTLIGLGFLILTDIYRRVKTRIKRKPE
jgi:predicted CXXCH cytochrome family protein